MLFKDNALKRVSFKVALKFISLVYNPLVKYCKTLKTSDLQGVKEFHDFLFGFKKNVALRDALGLKFFDSSNEAFSKVVSNHRKLYDGLFSIYGIRLFDVSILIINKVIDNYNKKFKDIGVYGL